MKVTVTIDGDGADEAREEIVGAIEDFRDANRNIEFTVDQEEPPTTVHLTGTIPVTVVVEFEGDAATVSRVIAHDELFEYTTNDEGFLVAGVDTRDVGQELLERARAVAEKAEWPVWKWGW